MFAHSAAALGPRFGVALGIVGLSKVRSLARSGIGRVKRAGDILGRHAPDRHGRTRRHIGARDALATRRPKADLARLADDLAGIHATDPASVYMELRARTMHLARADVERALCDDRTLVKVLGMRRTMFVASPVFAGVINAAAAIEIAVGNASGSTRSRGGGHHEGAGALGGRGRARD
jgi:hypothetical protein